MPAALTTILRLLVGILTLQTCQCQKCIDRYDRICDGAFAIFGHLEERKAVLSYNCLDPQDFPNYHFCHFGGIWSANVWTCLNHHQLDNLITKPTVQHTLQDDVLKKTGADFESIPITVASDPGTPGRHCYFSLDFLIPNLKGTNISKYWYYTLHTYVQNVSICVYI